MQSAHGRAITINEYTTEATIGLIGVAGSFYGPIGAAAGVAVGAAVGLWLEDVYRPQFVNCGSEVVTSITLCSIIPRPLMHMFPGLTHMAIDTQINHNSSRCSFDDFDPIIGGAPHPN